MTTTTQVDHEQRVADLEGEIRDLEGRIKEAKASAEEASNRLVDLSRGMDELSPDVYAGDSDAALDFTALEDEHTQFERQHRIARVAADKLTAELALRRDELKEARTEAARARYDALVATIPERREALEGAAKELKREFKELAKTRQKLLEHASGFLEGRSLDGVLLYAPTDPVVTDIRRLLRGLL
jgi:chromosome segregation ATPase